MTEVIVLDPAAVVTDTTRTQLDITQYIRFAGVNWDDAKIQTYLADKLVGSTSVAARIPNRFVEIPLVLKGTSFYAIRQLLQQKAALFQREGGSIMRQINGVPYYGDVQNATLHLGGSSYQADSITPFDVDATLELEVLPDWYGNEVTLDTITGTGHINGKLQQSAADAVIAGNYPGRVRIVLSDTSANDQKGLLWAFRSRRYDSAASAADFYEAEALTSLNGSSSIVNANASGGHVLGFSSAMPSNNWVPMLMTTISSGTVPLTHKGTYRVWARVACGGTDASFRLVWGVGSLSTPIINPIAGPPPLIGYSNLYMMDLGIVRLYPSPVGTHQWFGVIQAYATNSSLPQIDCIYLQPVEEYSGKLIYTPTTSPGVISSTAVLPSACANDAATGTVAWNPSGTASTLLAAVQYPDVMQTASAAVNNSTAEYLKATGYTFSIPSGATIIGIQFNIYYGIDNPGNPYTWTPRLSKAGTMQSGAPSTVTTNSYVPMNPDGYVTSFGGATDLWGGTWLYSDINAAGFGAGFSFVSSLYQQIDVDYINCTVWYTLAAGFTVAQDTVIKASSTAELRTDAMVRDGGSGVYGVESNVVGDMPRIPPSGIENRPCELFVKNSRGDLTNGQLADSGLDSISAVVKYKPSFLYIGT